MQSNYKYETQVDYSLLNHLSTAQEQAFSITRLTPPYLFNVYLLSITQMLASGP